MNASPEPYPDITKPSSSQSSLPRSDKQGTPASVAMAKDSLVVSIMVRTGRRVGGRGMKGERVDTEGMSMGSSTSTGMTSSPPGK